MVESCSTGVGRHVIDLAAGILDRGHHVHLLYSRSRIDQRFEDGLASILARGGSAEEAQMHRDISHRDLLAMMTVNRVAKQRGPFDIIHGHSSKGGAIARVGGLLSGAKRVYSPHAFLTMSPELGGKKRRVYQILEKFFDSLGHATINVSEFERQHALELGLPTRKMRVVTNGVPEVSAADRETVRHELGITDEFVFGFIGRLAAQKNPIMLVESFAESGKGSHVAAKLVIVGDGPLRELARQRAIALGVDEAIIWTGDANGPRLIAAFDALALPSQYESFPYVLLEAGAHGIPMICTNTGAASEYVVPGQTGFVVPVGDTAGFSEAMASVAGDPDLAKRMGEAALVRSRQFTLDAMVDGIERIYLDLLD